MKFVKIALSIALTMMLATVTMLSAFAAGTYIPNNPYIYDHVVPGDGYDGPKFHYFSVYKPTYAIDGVVQGYNTCYLYTLYNTNTQKAFPAYCTDIDTEANESSKYRRLNLEDSTYAGTVAGKLRAIVKEGFYLNELDNETTEAHRARVDDELKKIGEAVGISDLSIGEAITATQMAVWQVAHGTRLAFTDESRAYVRVTASSSYTKYHNLCVEETTNGRLTYGSSYTMTNDCKEWVDSRILKVFDYLLALEPIAQSQMAVSEYSFVQTHDPVLTKNADGTYDVSVTASIEVTMAPGDDLTLSAVIDETHFVSKSLKDGKQTVTLTLENVPSDMARKDVTLNIDGNQTITEVVLFEAEGGRDASQSMIGAEYSRSPVHTHVLAQESRSLSFYKTTVVDVADNKTERYPLQGITFDIYLAAEMSDYLSGRVVLPDAEDYDTSSRADFTIITDTNGRGTINFTQHGYPDGMYLVVERNHPAIREPIKPFYVAMPMTNANGMFEYAVTVQPKNDVKGEVKIEKDINSIGKDKDSVNAYENHSWIISTNIPEDIADGKSFTITDLFDNRLDYAGNMKINIENADGTEVFFELIPDTDYVLTVHDYDSVAEGHPSDSFEIEITHTGMKRIADEIGTNSYDNYRLRVHFEAHINANANMSAEVPNSAVIEYVNSVNFKFIAESDKSYVYTGGVNLLKVDAKDNDKRLQGAVFEVYRLATEEEVANNFEGITYLDGIVAPVVKTSFIGNGVKETFTVTSDENGDVSIYGLKYGKYYIVETSAPAGYSLVGGPIAVEINENSHKETIFVENKSDGILMPGTGGMGTTVFTVGGVALMFVAIVLLVSKKRMAR